MTPLGREIASLIAVEGPISVARYMALCLGHPTLGYYATRDPFGADGDFTTAPEISQMFGELIGLWCAEAWAAMGAPPRVVLVELGPGRGTLMADLLRAARAAPGFREALDVTLVETSPTLRAVQARTLEGAGVPVRWADSVHESLDAAPPEGKRPLPLLVVANEFFDALPVRQFVRIADGWRERVVGLGPGGELGLGLAPDAPTDVALPDCPEGDLRELCAPALDIVASLADHMARHGGAGLVVDYGYVSGAGDTLQAMARHAFVDPLAAPGEADLTAHVDFAALALAARGRGAAVSRPIAQADLLERLGLAARAERLSAQATADQRAGIAAAVARLTDRAPTGMGALFKALAFADPRLGAPPAFDLADPRPA
ncbi:class I SAM-dependent methyltransferase [Hansschlegelia sp. KR7-227]|uniref:class I SAM-dependent methyltransferase n=1 Tax=Hansschlegelia sp. KR7-227 TaxID=3400914 RepID=UPI003BFD528D